MKVHIFDCDGVITDTNDIKTDAFRHVAEKYLCKKAITKLLEFHSNNLGKSRWEKFNFIKAKGLNLNYETDFLCEKYSFYVESNIFNKGLVPYVKDYINNLYKNKENKLFIASGGESSQVKRLMNYHHISIPEDNIFGSPEDKQNIVKRIKKTFNNSEFIFYGDSIYDAECAALINAKFIFVSGYTTSKVKQIKDNYPIALEIKNFENFMKK